MPSQSPRDRLPFEPRQKKKKAPQRPANDNSSKAQEEKAAAGQKNQPNTTAIPEMVSKRMVRRMALLSGIPTGLGMFSFVAFYWIVSHHWMKIPTYAVAIVSFGLFGLGIAGLSYGIFSTSWDEQRVGGLVGWEEFQVNFGRMVNAWRSARQTAKESQQK